MEKYSQALELIDLMICPGFCVKENRIIRVNDAARRLFLEPGMEVLPLIAAGKEAYASFESGCLYLTLTLAGELRGASVTKAEDLFVFLADEETELRELQVLALAAQSLRMPLTGVMLSADQLGRSLETEEEKESAARLSRGTAQLQRLICNMSDALRYLRNARLQVRNITSLLEEIFEKARTLTDHTDISLRYQGLSEAVYTLTEPEQLERAVYNLISNALKFTPKGGTIDVRLTKSGKLLQLTVEDSGSGIGDQILKSVFTRYLRQPSLEDSRFGLGLGLVIVRAAAKNHGGTVLIDRTERGTRISMTIAIRENPQTMVRSPILTVDYAGERDHGLLELSESLPYTLYEREPEED